MTLEEAARIVQRESGATRYDENRTVVMTPEGYYALVKLYQQTFNSAMELL